MARTLEQEWEKRLAEISQAKGQLEESRRVHAHSLSEAERSQLRRLSTDLRSVWSAPTTSDRDRKELLHTLLEEVSIDIKRGESTAGLVRRIAPHYSNATIAAILNRQGRRTVNGQPFAAEAVRSLRRSGKLSDYAPGPAGLRRQPFRRNGESPRLLAGRVVPHAPPCPPGQGHSRKSTSSIPCAAPAAVPRCGSSSEPTATRQRCERPVITDPQQVLRIRRHLIKTGAAARGWMPLP